MATAGNAKDALTVAAPFGPQLAILGVMIPDVDGFELRRRLTASFGHLPTIFLTVCDATADKVRGLSAGADATSQARSAVERSSSRVRASASLPVTPRLRSGWSTPMSSWTTTHSVTRAGAALDLTATEYTLLRYFLLNPGRVLSKR